jgi:nicotinic acid mononucleotide adenylyltransferase
VIKFFLVPSYSHANKKDMSNFDERLSMVKLFTDDLFSNKNVEVLDIERYIFNGEPVYTYYLMDKLRSIYSHDELFNYKKINSYC